MKRDHFLMMASVCQFALFVPLAFSISGYESEGCSFLVQNAPEKLVQSRQSFLSK